MKAKVARRPLIVRHLIKGRFVRSYRIHGNQVLVGSAVKNRIRLLSQSIAGVACVLENQKDGWTLSDLGSEPDLKWNGKPFVEEKVLVKGIIEIGDHKLEVVPVAKRRPIFTDTGSLNGERLTVVKYKGHVIETLETDAEAEAYKNSKSPHIEISHYTTLPVPKLSPRRFEVDADMKKPLIGTFTTLIVFLAILFGLPISKPETKIIAPADNVYTRMIFDSKVLTQKKKQLVSYGVKSPKGTGNGNGQISEGAKGTASKAVKAVASLRQAGVSSLIAKIAGRANQSAKMLAAMAATPMANASVDEKQMGAMNAMPSTNAATGKTGILGNGKGFKVGGIGTGGKGGGTGDYKAGSGLGTGATGNGEVGIEDTESVVEGGLDREVIAGVIRDHLGQIRYCYERQLAGNPDLLGKVKVRFSIAADGSVDSQAIGQSTLKSAMVEECILRRIATWKFPHPKGGTKVLVSYPFLFKSVN